MSACGVKKSCYIMACDVTKLRNAEGEGGGGLTKLEVHQHWDIFISKIFEMDPTNLPDLPHSHSTEV